MDLYRLLSILIGIILVVYVSVHSYNKHSLSYGGALTAGIVGCIHVIAGWRHAILLIFFFVTSSKLTKMWSNVKRQKEDGFVFGGERNYYQVLSNSFVPTLACIYVSIAKSGFFEGLSSKIAFQENMLILPMVLAYYCECSADTWGSEIGILSPKPYLLLNPRKPVPAGTNGGISVLGMSAAVCAGVMFSLLYYLIRPAGVQLPFSAILLISLFSAIAGTFLDSWVGSVAEESWWCATKKRVVHYSLTACDGCKIAKKEGKRVTGGAPSECGLICGCPVLSGNGVNLICSSLISIVVGLGLYILYF